MNKLRYIQFKDKPTYFSDIVHFLGITNYLQGIYEIDGFEIKGNILTVWIMDRSA